MDVILLSGGFGTRLEPISSFIPKALLPVGGRPLIDRIVDHVATFKQVERIIVDTNSKFEDQFRHYVKTKTASGFGKKLELLIEPTRSHGEKLGQIRGIEYAVRNARITSDFMIISTDNYFDFSLEGIIAHFERSKNPTLGLFETKDMELLTRSGVVSLKGSKIVEFEEKPQKPKSSLLSMGFYIFPKGSVKLIDEYMVDNSNHDSMGYFIKWLIEKHETDGVVCKGIWIDIGTMEAYKRVFEMTSNKE
ncbi:MAG: nucleotidyltransferase family protein [Candidatus Micrarchaeota archaeon]|nr:nucleotidyltransferase family protein [Candidatus Micrarchaeota archaeon]